MNDDTEAPGLFADLAITLRAHIEGVDRLTKELAKPPKRTPPQTPVFARIQGTVIVGSNGLGLIEFNLKGPDVGHFWYVRSLVIGGLTPTTTAAGRGDIYVSASANPAATLAILGLSDWRDQAATLPDVSFYGRGELGLRLNEQLLVLLSGATSGQQYVAAASIEDFEEGASEQTWDK